MTDTRAKRMRFVAGDVVVFMVAPTRRAMESLARRRPTDSWARAARRIIARLDRNGMSVSYVARELARRAKEKP